MGMNQLEGKVTDYGDTLHVERWIVKGRRLNGVFHVGAPVKATVFDRLHNSGTAVSATGKVDFYMDLMADKKVPLSVQWTDEMGNPVSEAPVGATVTYSTDAPSVIVVADVGDGTAWAAATGALGAATVHMQAEAPGMAPTSGDVQFMVVAGLAERANIVVGDPVEVTSDEVSPL